jgi:hypothetical protein
VEPVIKGLMLNDLRARDLVEEAQEEEAAAG